METANDETGSEQAHGSLPTGNVSDTLKSVSSNLPSGQSSSGTSSVGGPAVLAQPLAGGPSDASAAGVMHPTSNSGDSSRTTIDLVKGALANAQDALATRYRAASSSTDDFVHESPWKALAFAMLGGVIVGMLAAR